jgi:hypothetical protein
MNVMNEESSITTIPDEIIKKTGDQIIFKV